MSWKSSRTCTASSRVGTSTSASGCRSALGSSCSTIGIAKPSVLPDPVFDFANVSRPAVASWITITWIGNGTTIPRATRAWTTGSDTPRSRNERTSEDIYEQAYLGGERQAPTTSRLPRPAVVWPATATLGGAMDDRHQVWNDLAAQIAVDSIRCTTAAGSGHPTSSMSCAHLLAVLFADHLRTDVSDPKSLANDRFVMSKGHAAPLLYSAL